MQTLSPASSTLARRAVTEKSAGLFWLYARREGPPHPCAMRRRATASAARPLWTRRVNPPSSLITPKKQSTASEERYLITSLPEPFSLPNCLAHPVQFYLPLPDQPDQSPNLTQLANKFEHTMPHDQHAAEHPHWLRAQILRCGDVHPNPGPTSLALINVTALRPRHHEVLDLKEDMVALTETRLTQGAQNAMAFMARQKGWQLFWGGPLVSKTGGIWGAAPGGAALLVREKWPAKQA